MSLDKEFENNALFQVRLLAQRVEALTREKEEIEENARNLKKDVVAMQKTFQRGAGMMIALPILGTLIGLALAYGKVIFAPWLKGGPP